MFPRGDVEHNIRVITQFFVILSDHFRLENCISVIDNTCRKLNKNVLFWNIYDFELLFPPKPKQCFRQSQIIFLTIPDFFRF